MIYGAGLFQNLLLRPYSLTWVLIYVSSLFTPKSLVGRYKLAVKVYEYDVLVYMYPIHLCFSYKCTPVAYNDFVRCTFGK